MIKQFYDHAGLQIISEYLIPIYNNADTSVLLNFAIALNIYCSNSVE